MDSDSVLEKIARAISEPAYEAWFKHTDIELEDDVLIVITPNVFAKEWLEVHYKHLFLILFVK